MRNVLATILLYSKKMYIVFLTFFSPIQMVLLSVGMFIMLDTGVGIWKSSKMKKKITSRKMSRVIQKMLIYQLCVITFFALDYAMIHDFVIESLAVDYALTKVVALVLISIEFYSIDESFNEATGRGLIDRFKDLIKGYKSIKNEGIN